MLKSLFVAAAALVGAAQFAHADDAAEKVVRDALHTLAPSAKPDLVRKSEVPGFYEGVVNGQVLFASADDKYLAHGEVIDVASKTSVNRRAGRNGMSPRS